VFYLQATNDAEKADWMKQIKETIDKLKAGVDLDKKEVMM
jgi:hypothetical protein